MKSIVISVLGYQKMKKLDLRRQNISKKLGLERAEEQWINSWFNAGADKPIVMSFELDNCLDQFNLLFV